VLAQGDELGEADFPQIAAQVPEFRSAELAATAVIVPVANPAQPRRDSVIDANFPGHQRRDGGLSTRPDPRMLLAAAYPTSDNVIASTDDAGEVRKLADVEEELIRFALKFYRGQMSQVARKLGIGRSTLYRKLKDYGIDPDDPLREAA
jgi:DNA-binding NtrC family response regulator